MHIIKETCLMKWNTFYKDQCCTSCFKSKGTKITECPSYSLVVCRELSYISFTLNNKIVALSKPPHRRQGPDLRPLWMLCRTPLVLRPLQLNWFPDEHSLSMRMYRSFGKILKVLWKTNTTYYTRLVNSADPVLKFLTNLDIHMDIY